MVPESPRRTCDWFWCDEQGRYDGLCLRHFEKASAIAAAERGEDDGGSGT